MTNSISSHASFLARNEAWRDLPVELVEELLDLAATTARRVGDELRSRRPDDLPYLQKEGAKGEVSALDVWAENEIARLILGVRPDDGFFGEEGADRESKSGVVWKVDPIDGSVSFIRGFPGWTVVVAAEYQGVPVAAAVYDPSTVGPDGRAGELFVACAGCGVTLNDVSVNPRSCTALGQDVVVGVGYEPDVEVRAAQARTFAGWFPQVRDVRRVGSSVREAVYVSAGRLDALYSYLYPYETSAVEVFAQSSGAMLTVEDVESRRHPGCSRVVMAATPGLHEAVLGAIKVAEIEGGLVTGGRLVV